MQITTREVDSPKGIIRLFRFTNPANGASVELSNLGAGITSFIVPDRDGNLKEVALSYPDPTSWFYDGPCAGKTVGRYANRIGGARFTIDDTTYTLDANDRGNAALHGGREGFQNQLWDAKLLADGVKYSYVAEEGEEGYPGRLEVEVVYKFEAECTLDIELKAKTDRPTIVNLTNHAYWNLRGEDAGSCLDHVVKINASRYVPSDDMLVPTGEIKAVDDTPMDFREPKSLERDFHEPFEVLVFDRGYDTSYLIDGWQPIDTDELQSGTYRADAVIVESPATGRRLTIGSSHSAAHLYTGNWLDDSPVGRSGRRYRDYDAVAVEMQAPPDCPNHPNFPNTILRPGQTYLHRITYSFTIF